MQKVSPLNCGDSVRMQDGFCICKLECIPCPVQFGKDCVRVKMNKLVDAIKGLLQESDGKAKVVE